MGENPFVPNNSKDGAVPLRVPSNREPAMVGTSSVSGTINVPLSLSLSEYFLFKSSHFFDGLFHVREAI